MVTRWPLTCRGRVPAVVAPDDDDNDDDGGNGNGNVDDGQVLPPAAKGKPEDEPRRGEHLAVLIETETSAATVGVCLGGPGARKVFILMPSLPQ
ncbi:unnamed protein product [Arctogadus glacialis]